MGAHGTVGTARRRRRARGPIAATTMAFVVVSLAVTPSSAQTSEWSRVAPPSGIRPLAMLNAVAAGSATRAWAVGQEYAGGSSTGATAGVPLVLQLDGRQWTKTPMPSGVTWKGSLSSVAAAGPSAAWAVGTDVEGRGRLLSYNGGSWLQTALPTSGAVRDLRVVAAPGEAPWIFGVSVSTSRPFLLTWTGSEWADVAPPPAPFTASTVHVAANGTVWLAGHRLVQPPELPMSVPVLMLYQRSGPDWVAMPEGPHVWVRDVLAGPDGTVWVAGGHARTSPGGPIGTPPTTALVQWDGDRWAAAPVAGWGMPVLSADDAGRPEWALGSYTMQDGRPVVGYLKHTADGWVRVPGAAVVPPEVDPAVMSGLAHLPGTTSTLAVGWARYPYEDQRIPRIEREDAP